MLHLSVIRVSFYQDYTSAFNTMQHAHVPKGVRYGANRGSPGERIPEHTPAFRIPAFERSNSARPVCVCDNDTNRSRHPSTAVGRSCCNELRGGLEGSQVSLRGVCSPGVEPSRGGGRGMICMHSSAAYSSGVCQLPTCDSSVCSFDLSYGAFPASASRRCYEMNCWHQEYPLSSQRRTVSVTSAGDGLLDAFGGVVQGVSGTISLFLASQGYSSSNVCSLTSLSLTRQIVAELPRDVTIERSLSSWFPPRRRRWLVSSGTIRQLRPPAAVVCGGGSVCVFTKVSRRKGNVFPIKRRSTCTYVTPETSAKSTAALPQRGRTANSRESLAHVLFPLARGAGRD